MVSNSATLQPEDVLAVRSRIKWGAIVAGSVIALAMYFLLSLLGGAIGFSISGSASAKTIGIAAAIWAIVVTAGCLFFGGFIASQLTVGENKTEAALYGILVWAVVFGMLVWLMATGVRLGFNAMMGVATASSNVVNTTAQNTTQEDWEAMARRSGFTQQQIDDMKQRAKNAPGEVRVAAEDPAARARAEAALKEAGDDVTRVTWYAFIGTLISMLAAAAGGYVGAGPTYRIFTTTVRTTDRLSERQMTSV